MPETSGSCAYVSEPAQVQIVDGGWITMCQCTNLKVMNLQCIDVDTIALQPWPIHHFLFGLPAAAVAIMVASACEGDAQRHDDEGLH